MQQPPFYFLRKLLCEVVKLLKSMGIAVKPLGECCQILMKNKILEYSILIIKYGFEFDSALLTKLIQECVNFFYGYIN